MSYFSFPEQQFLDVYKWDTIYCPGVGLQVFHPPLTELSPDVINIMLKNRDICPLFFSPALGFKMSVYLRLDAYINVLVPLKQTKRHEYTATNYNVGIFRQVKLIDFVENILTFNFNKTRF